MNRRRLKESGNFPFQSNHMSDRISMRPHTAFIPSGGRQTAGQPVPNHKKAVRTNKFT